MLLIKLFLHMLYRIRLVDMDIPDKGRLIVTCNHISYLDAFLVRLASPRPLRFIMYYKIYNIPIAKYFFKWVGCIPIASPREDLKVFKKAFKEIEKALRNDEAVMIFPEGHISHSGTLQPFKGGIEHIVNKTPSDVYCMSLNNLYGSYFSRSADKPFFGKLRSTITIRGGRLIKPEDVSRESIFQETERIANDNG